MNKERAERYRQAVKALEDSEQPGPPPCADCRHRCRKWKNFERDERQKENDTIDDWHNQ